MGRLPIPGADDGIWGDVLNTFLQQAHNTDGTLKNTGALAEKYSIPASGIPKVDMAASVQATLGKADSAEQTVNKGTAGGYAALGADGLVPIAQLPPYPIPKQSAVVCATTNVNVSAPGSSIDGVTLSNGNRVLLVGQTSAAQNGIYQFNGAASAMTRTSDADSSADLVNAFLFVNQGTQAQAGWENTTPAPITVDSTALTWVQFEAPVTVTNTQLNDTNGNLAVATSATASAVNQLTVTNAATGNKPIIAASGSDTDILLGLRGKGDRGVQIDSTASGSFQDLVVHNSTNDATVQVVTDGSNKAAYVNLFSTTASFLAFRGWVNSSLKWGVGRSGGSDGVSIYTLDGVTQAVHFDDTQNTRLKGGLWYKRTAVSDAAYPITNNDLIVAYTALTAPRTATLPTAASAAGQLYIVKDESGAAATHNITIATTSLQTIDGVTTKAINANYGWIAVYSNGSNWAVVGQNGTSSGSSVTMFPNYKSGHYYYSSSPGGNNTSTLGSNGTVRATPLILQSSVSIARVGMEFTVAGDAASVFRIGVWNDDGTGLPGTLVQDCGTISTGTGNAGDVATGGTPGTYEVTLGSPLVLSAGTYWLGGAQQGVTTTSPTIRTVSSQNIDLPISQPTTKPSAGFASAGFTGTAQTGAFGTFAGHAVTSNIPRLFFRVS